MQPHDLAERLDCQPDIESDQKGVQQGIIIIQLYFRPQWVHRKDNTKDAEHVNITQITKYALNMSAYHSAVRLYKVAIHLLFSFDATCTSLLITLCVIKLKETSSLQRRLYIDRLILA